MASDLNLTKAFMPRRGRSSHMVGESATKQNIILGSGEMFVEYPDSGVGTGPSKIKIGDGVTTYNNLPYAINPEDNVIIGIQVNSVDLEVSDGRKVNIAIPVNVSEVLNDVGYITKEDETIYSLSIKPTNATNGSAVLTLATDEDPIVSEIKITGTGGTEVTSTEDGDLEIHSPTIGPFVGATSLTPGVAGLVPPPEANKENYFLRADGQWVDIYNGGNDSQYDFGAEDGADDHSLAEVLDYGNEDDTV